MEFAETSLPDLILITLAPVSDERGHLMRTYCAAAFRERGLNTEWPQCNATLTRNRGMIRGLHYQAEPHPETKLIRCLAGAVWDVVVDVRPGSPTFGRWEAFELTPGNGRQLYVPDGFAHGFQTLAEDSELYYQMSASYRPELARGVRWNDPEIGIEWPLEENGLSDRDRSLPLLSDQ